MVSPSSWEWGSEGNGETFPSGSCVDVDRMCKNVHHSFFSLDIHSLKTASQWRLLLRQGAVKHSVKHRTGTHKSHWSSWKHQARQSLTCFLVLKPFDLNWSHWLTAKYIADSSALLSNPSDLGMRSFPCNSNYGQRTCPMVWTHHLATRTIL